METAAATTDIRRVTRIIPDVSVSPSCVNELRASADVLGVRDVVLLDHEDGQLDRVPPRQIISQLAGEIRRVRPDVVLTFAPDGAYGHPDHVAVSQFATAAIVAAANPSCGEALGASGNLHAVQKLYYLAWSAAEWAAYQAAFKTLAFTVDGSRAVARVEPYHEDRHSAVVAHRLACCLAAHLSDWRVRGARTAGSRAS